MIRITMMLKKKKSLSGDNCGSVSLGRMSSRQFRCQWRKPFQNIGPTIACYLG